MVSLFPRKLLPRKALVSTLAAVTLAITCAPSARADESADALINKGLDLREKGKDEEALAMFKQALAKAPTARARAQVALAEQALGMWVQAEQDMTTALAMEGDAWIAKNRPALESALATVRKHLGSLEVRGAKEGAEVFLDGVRLGIGQGPFRVEAGKRTLEVRASGFHSTTRAVEIPAGGVARETVTLVASSSTTETPPAAEKPTASSERPVDVKKSDDDGHTQRLLGWVAVGTGAALLATGGAGLLVRKGIVDDYNRGCNGLGATTQPAGCDDQASSSRTWLTISIITLVGGTLFAGGGVVLVATAPSAEGAKTAGAATRASCAPSLGGLVCAGTF